MNIFSHFGGSKANTSSMSSDDDSHFSVYDNDPDFRSARASYGSYTRNLLHVLDDLNQIG